MANIELSNKCIVTDCMKVENLLVTLEGASSWFSNLKVISLELSLQIKTDHGYIYITSIVAFGGISWTPFFPYASSGGTISNRWK